MFRVDWLQSVQLDILGFWFMRDAAFQAQVSAAVNELERRLASDPPNEGESRDGDARVTFERPLDISFTVDVSARVVTVDNVWLFQ